jgi:hypothetical protein
MSQYRKGFINVFLVELITTPGPKKSLLYMTYVCFAKIPLNCFISYVHPPVIMILSTVIHIKFNLRYWYVDPCIFRGRVRIMNVI